MTEAVMNAYAISYPSLQRRLIARRRSRALFLPRTTQHVRRTSLLRELGRAVAALAAIAAWGAAIVVLAA
ncbi:MAG: hypothetical protein ACREME_03770 [Gemmatimonadales bacterium]